MKQSTGNYLLADAIATHQNNFNAVRLVLALAVVFFHAYPVAKGVDPLSRMLGPALDLGSFSVGNFFFLSGLFVTQSWLKCPHLLPFLGRRFLRIIPGLAVCVFFTTVIAVCFFSAQGITGLLQSQTWIYVINNSFIFFLQESIFQSSLRLPGVFNYLADGVLNGPLWTLFWEGRFYIALGLLGASAVTTSKYWFGLVGTCLLLYIGLDASNIFPLIKNSLWEYRLLSLFVCGMIVCVSAHFITIYRMTILGIIFYIYFNYEGSGVFGIYLFSCVTTLWIGTLKINLLPFLRTHDYSYAVYIYHYPILQMLKKFYPENGWDFTLFLSAILCLLPISALSWRYIEKPAIQFGGKLSSKLISVWR
jgi:peptidoglycan/LPS O-acetylase OafA/YrhL